MRAGLGSPLCCCVCSCLGAGGRTRSPGTPTGRPWGHEPPSLLWVPPGRARKPGSGRLVLCSSFLGRGLRNEHDLGKELGLPAVPHQPPAALGSSGRQVCVPGLLRLCNLGPQAAWWLASVVTTALVPCPTGHTRSPVGGDGHDPVWVMHTLSVAGVGNFPSHQPRLLLPQALGSGQDTCLLWGSVSPSAP